MLKHTDNNDCVFQVEVERLFQMSYFIERLSRSFWQTNRWTVKVSLHSNKYQTKLVNFYPSFSVSAYQFPFEISTGKVKLVDSGTEPSLYIAKPWLDYLKQPSNRESNTKFLRDVLKRLFHTHPSNIALAVITQRRIDKIDRYGGDCSFTEIVGEWFIQELKRECPCTVLQAQLIVVTLHINLQCSWTVLELTPKARG